MYKNIFLFSFLASIHVYASTNFIEVSTVKGIEINNKLIKELYKQNDLLQNKINKLQEKIYFQEERSHMSIKKDNYTHMKKEFIAQKKMQENNKYVNVMKANVRTRNKSSSRIISVFEIGKKVSCVSVDSDWCKIAKNTFIHNNLLSTVKNIDLLVVRDTTERNHPSIKKNTYKSRLKKGMKLIAIGITRDRNWYILNESSFVHRSNIRAID